MQLLCKNPATRLRNLDCFKMQAFFRGTSFDSLILQKTPVDVVLELRTHPDWAAKATRGLSLDYVDNFDCDKILHSPTSPTELPPTLADVDLSPATEQTCEAWDRTVFLRLNNKPTLDIMNISLINMSSLGHAWTFIFLVFESPLFFCIYSIIYIITYCGPAAGWVIISIVLYCRQ